MKLAFGFLSKARTGVGPLAFNGGAMPKPAAADRPGQPARPAADREAAGDRPDKAPAPAARLLNLGCGARWHPAWVNVDLAPASPDVLAHDLAKPLPFPDESFDAVYHSHVLEHLPRARVPDFFKECWRVLVSGGTLRVAVPDLETIARLYLENLAAAVDGDTEAAHRYDWMVLELLDQLVREQSGGEMLNYWRQQPLPAEAFVLARSGDELRRVLPELRAAANGAGFDRAAPTPAQAAAFRAGGEVHRWMYDRFSLSRLLRGAGFVNARVCSAHESAIFNFHLFGLDVTPEGAVRKPDSLFMEASKP